MTESERDKIHCWNKTYIVYNKRLDILGIHKGPKFLDLGDNEILFWPHDVDHGGMTSVLCDKSFRAWYAYVGEL